MANISENKGYGFLGKAVEENETIEFKSSFNIATIETLTAFANTKGGSVYIGISDSRKIVGVALSPESIQQWVNEIKSKTDPSVLVDATTMEIDGKTIVRLATQEHAIKPVACQGRFYKRIRNSNHLMSALEISNLSLQSMQVSWDSFPAYGQTIEDLDIEKIDKFINRVNTKGRLSLIGKDRMDNLSKLRLLRDGQPTHAAYLLFGKENIGYNVHLGRFKTPSLIIDDRMLNCNLFDAVEETMKYLIGQIKVAYEITGRTTQRTEIFEYPLPALREIVLNTLIHRDYTSSVDVQIKIFDQKITFFSPGGLFDKQTIEALKTDNYQAYTRNKLIAEAFYLAGDIEKYGTGYTRIRNEIKDYPTMSFEFEEMANAWLVTLSYEKQHISSKDNENDAENIFEKLSERQRLIIDQLQKKSGLDTVNGTVNGTVNAQKLSDLLGVSLRTIKRELYVLQDLGLIRHTGSDKTGSWELCAFIPDYQAEDTPANLPENLPANITENIFEKLSERQRLIIGHLQKNAEVGTVNGTEDDTVNDTVNAKKLSELLGVSLSTVKRELYALQNLGLIRHTGSDKTGYWEIVQNTEN